MAAQPEVTRCAAACSCGRCAWCPRSARRAYRWCTQRRCAPQGHSCSTHHEGPPERGKKRLPAEAEKPAEAAQTVVERAPDLCARRARAWIPWSATDDQHQHHHRRRPGDHDWDLHHLPNPWTQDGGPPERPPASEGEELGHGRSPSRRCGRSPTEPPCWPWRKEGKEGETTAAREAHGGRAEGALRSSLTLSRSRS
jgi:hypothetical protein